MQRRRQAARSGTWPKSRSSRAHSSPPSGPRAQGPGRGGRRRGATLQLAWQKASLSAAAGAAAAPPRGSARSRASSRPRTAPARARRGRGQGHQVLRRGSPSCFSYAPALPSSSHSSFHAARAVPAPRRPLSRREQASGSRWLAGRAGSGAGAWPARPLGLSAGHWGRGGVGAAARRGVASVRSPKGPRDLRSFQRADTILNP